MAAEERMKKEEIEVLLKKENPNVDLERCSVSCTSSSSMNGYASKWEASGMVKIELDAARALADFAQLALLESENPSGESNRKWGQKGKRSKKRFKNEKTSEDCKSNLESSKLMSVDLVQQDPSIEALPWDKKPCKNVAIKQIKAEQDSELPTTTPTCPTNYVPSSGGKSKQHLTEAEKEARRLRRVLANRESARQTIRRRQAMYEELSKKAADLASDNQSMRREKELVMKEYQSLKDKNKHLKSEMTRVIKDEAEETSKETPTVVEAPASSEKLPLLEYNGPPFTPFIWPPIIQAFNPVQTQPITQNGFTLQDPVAANNNTNPSQEQGNPLSTNGSRPHFYIVPCPWFFPLPDHGNQLHPHPLDTGGLRIKQDDRSVSCQHVTGPSSKSVENGSSTTESHPTNDLPKVPIRLPTNEGGQLLSGHPNGVILMPPALRSVKPEPTVKSENGVQQDSISKTESFSSTVGHIPENKQEPGTYACKKLVDAAAAAEARKRRKELTKLKNCQSRQLRLRC